MWLNSTSTPLKMSKSDLGKQRQDLFLSICKPDCDDGIEVLMSPQSCAANVWAGGVCHFRRVKYTKH